MIPPVWVSIDPGGKHVGMAWWNMRNECKFVAECTPVSAMREIERRHPRQLVVEQFQLYPHLAQTLAGSTMETSQLIGAMAWWAFSHGSQFYLQPAAIKVPIRSFAKAFGIKPPPTNSEHARDAHLHGVYFIHQNKQQPGSFFTGDYEYEAILDQNENIR